MPTATWERLPEERRSAVLAAAEAEFGAHGFSKGSLNVIAREAGVSKGSLFQYFDDKADLCAHLADIVSLRIRASLEPLIATLDWDGDFWPSLRRFAHEWVRYFADHPRELALTAAANLELDASSRAAVRLVVNRHYVEVLTPLLEQAKGSGALGPGADLDAFLALLMLVFPHLAIASANPELDAVLGLGRGTPADSRRAADRLLDVLRHGLV